MEEIKSVGWGVLGFAQKGKSEKCWSCVEVGWRREEDSISSEDIVKASPSSWGWTNKWDTEEKSWCVWRGVEKNFGWSWED